MSRRRRTTAGAMWDLHYGPNMTPMVDVVMVILIFFMASASVLGPEWFLRTSLPIVRPEPVTIDTPEGPKKEYRYEFTLTRTGNSTRVTGAGLDNADFNSLRFLLEQIHRDHRADSVAILIRPDPGVPYQELVVIHAVCQKLGIQKIGMLDRSPDLPAPPQPTAPADAADSPAPPPKS